LSGKYKYHYGTPGSVGMGYYKCKQGEDEIKNQQKDKLIIPGWRKGGCMAVKDKKKENGHITQNNHRKDCPLLSFFTKKQGAGVHNCILIPEGKLSQISFLFFSSCFPPVDRFFPVCYFHQTRKGGGLCSKIH